METAAGTVQIIQRYGPGGFAISGVTFTGPVLVMPEQTLVWSVASYDSITVESLAPIGGAGGIELLLFGTGGAMKLVPAAIRVALRQVGIVVDGMDTAAACRTYGILAAENRRVAAALLPLRF